MDRTTVWLTRISVATLVAVVALLTLALASPTADAAVSMGYSSIDNPQGEAFIADLGTGLGADVAVAAAGTGVATAGAAAVASTVATAWSGVPVAITGTLAVTATGVLAATFFAPKSSTTLTQAVGNPAGFNAPAIQGPFGWLGATVDFSHLVITGGYLGNGASATGYMTLSWPQSYDYPATSSGGYSATASVVCRNLTTGAMVDAGSVAGSSSSGNGLKWTATTKTYNPSSAKSCPVGTGFDHIHFSSFVSRSTTPASNTVVSADWFPLGSESWTPQQSGGLTGTLVTTADCVGPTGTRSFSSSVAATAVGDSVPLSWPGVQCNAGETLGHFVVDWVTSTGTQNVYTYTAPGWVQTMPVEYPGCVAGGCGVELWQVFSASPSLYCGVAAIGCPEWWSDSAKASHYQCRYGPYTAPLGLCAVFREPGKVLPNTTLRVDSNGQVVGSPTPIISTNPQDFVNVPQPVPHPVVVPDPPPGPIDIPDPVPSSDSSECWPGGWGVFNPAEWVQRPIMCAMAWTFIPRPAVVQADLQRGSDALADNGVLSVVPAALSVPATVTHAVTGGCTTGLAVIGADTQWGRLESTLPCSPSVTSAQLGAAYSPWYQVASVLMIASGAWAGFILVRSYVGGKD